MAITVFTFPGKKAPLVLGGTLFPHSRKAEKDALELLSLFFFHDGPVLALQSKKGSDQKTLFSNASLLDTIEESIIVQEDMLLVHTNDTRFSWNIDANHSVKLWQTYDVCYVFHMQNDDEISCTLFMRGAK